MLRLFIISEQSELSLFIYGNFIYYFPWKNLQIQLSSRDINFPPATSITSTALIRYQRASQTEKTRNEQSLDFQTNEQIFDIVAYLCRNIGVRFRPEPCRLIIAKRCGCQR